MDKNVLITGGGRGIGRACALRFAESGYNVAINYRADVDAARQTRDLARGFGVRAEFFCADVGNSDAVNEMFCEIERDFGEIDTLVCNAGVAQISLLSDVTDEQWRGIFATNMDGVFYCSRRALKNMVSRKCGNIITISSMWGQVGASCEVAYSASKAAVIGFTRALAKEVAPSGIRVNCVAPGAINTDMNAGLSHSDLESLCEEIPLGKIGSAADVANAVEFLASEKASYITGQIIAVNGGMVI